MVTNRRCCVRGCVGDSGRTFFSFPKVDWVGCGEVNFAFRKGFERCLHWIQRSGNPRLLFVHPERMYRSCFMCSAHFGVDQFAGPTRRRLKTSPLPGIFPHCGLPDEEMKQYVYCLTMCYASYQHLEGASENFSAKAGEDMVPSCYSPRKHPCYLHLLKREMLYSKLMAKKKTRVKRPSKKCSVVNCGNTNTPTRLFSFPRAISIQNFNRCKEWLKASGNDNLLGLNLLELWRHACICSDHFGDHQFFSKMRKKLLLSALPTERLPVAISQEKMDLFSNYLEQVHMSGKGAFMLQLRN